MSSAKWLSFCLGLNMLVLRNVTFSSLSGAVNKMCVITYQNSHLGVNKIGTHQFRWWLGADIQASLLTLTVILDALWHISLRWRHNEHDGVSNHQPHDCLPNRLFRRRSKETSKLPVTGPSVGNSPVTGEFPAQRASNAENDSICWRHHVDLIHIFVNEMILNFLFVVPTQFNLVGYVLYIIHII